MTRCSSSWDELRLQRKHYRILGSILGSTYFGKLLCGARHRTQGIFMRITCRWVPMNYIKRTQAPLPSFGFFHRCCAATLFPSNRAAVKEPKLSWKNELRKPYHLLYTHIIVTYHLLYTHIIVTQFQFPSSNPAIRS